MELLLSAAMYGPSGDVVRIIMMLRSPFGSLLKHVPRRTRRIAHKASTTLVLLNYADLIIVDGQSAVDVAACLIGCTGRARLLFDPHGARSSPVCVHRSIVHNLEHSAHSQKYLLGTEQTGKPPSPRTILSSGGTSSSTRRSVPPRKSRA